MTIEGSIWWPPACNPRDTKVPPNHFGANLTQFTNEKQTIGNHKSPVKKNRKCKNGNGTNHFKKGNGSNNHCDSKKKLWKGSSNKNYWKSQHPNKTKLDKYIRQTSVYRKKVNGKVFQWCQKHGEKRKWVLSHNTATHQDNFKHKNKHRSNHKNSVQVYIEEGLVVTDARLCGRSCTKRSTKLFPDKEDLNVKQC